MQVPQGTRSDYYPQHTVTSMHRTAAGEQIITGLMHTHTGMTPPRPQLLQPTMPQQPVVQPVLQPVAQQPSPANGSLGAFRNILADVNQDLDKVMDMDNNTPPQ
jgi:hypothetical protein